jgi:hypothetical protein
MGVAPKSAVKYSSSSLAEAESDEKSDELFDVFPYLLLPLPL